MILGTQSNEESRTTSSSQAAVHLRFGKCRHDRT
jgi:hypothetical protein